MFEKTKEFLGLSKKSTDFMPIGVSGGFDAMFGNQYSKQEVKKLTQSDYLALYTGWVYFSVSRIAQTIASLEYQVVNEKYEVIPDKHSGLIDSELIEGIVSFLLLNGSAFGKKQQIGKNINTINLLRPDLIQFIQTNGQELEGYKYRLPTGQYMNISIEEMMDIHLFNPMEVYPNKMKGVSPVQSVAIQMSSDIATQNWDWKFFENGATPSGVFTTQHDVSPDALDRFKTDWKSKYGGVQNSHKTAVLPFGVDYKTISPSQAELDFVNKRRFAKEEVFTIFGIPEALFAKDSNLATAKVAENTYMKYTILPLARKIENAFNKHIYKGQGKFQFVNVVPTDTDALTSIYTSGGITLNEYRQGMNYDPIKEGDVIRSIFGEITATAVEQKKAINEKMDKSIGKIEKTLKAGIRGTEEWKEKKWEEKIFRNMSYEAKYKKAFQQIFDIQERDIIGMIETKKSVKANKWNALKYATLYFTLLSQAQEELFQAEANEALRLANINSFFIVGNTLKNGFLRDNISRMAQDIDTTTKTEIFDLISMGEQSGLGVDAIVRTIREKFTTYKTSRIEAIVRTETISAGSKAYETAWQDSGVVEAKEWYTAMDERVCPHCNSMNGKTISLGDDFYKKGAIMDTGLKLDYRDIQGSPLHVSCRCTLLPVLKP